MSDGAFPPSSSPSPFLRALWGLDVAIERRPAPPAPSGAPTALTRPRFEAGRVQLVGETHLPSLAHCGAHLAFGGARFVVGGLKPVQVALLSLLEDARVERLASAQYPGLHRLWSPFHDARPDAPNTCLDLFARLARALHDDQYQDDDAWLSKARARFWARPLAEHDASSLRALASALGNDLGQMRVQFNARGYVVEPAYRDDHSGLWQPEEQDARADDASDEADHRVHAVANAPTRAARAEPVPARTQRDSQLSDPCQSEPASALAPPRCYPEWDYVISAEREAFCTVREKPVPTPDAPRTVPARSELARFARRLGAAQRRPLRRIADGEQLDLPAVVGAYVARRAGVLAGTRLYRSTRSEPERGAVLLLLDLSESLNERTGTRLDCARRASALLAEALTASSREFAIHGFSSNGRHDVGYYRLKDFDQPYHALASARVASLRAGLSTRLGPALRHAGQALATRRAARRLLFVVTDGEPSDVDIHDGNYLIFDAKQATLRNRARGIESFCIALDAQNEPSVRRMFGTTHYAVLDRIDSLPRALTRLCLRASA